MRLFSFFLFYKIFSFLAALGLSCSPENEDGNFISISLSLAPNWRFNIQGSVITPGIVMITFNTPGDRPDNNEIFMLKQPTTGVYEFQPFIDFYQATALKEIIKNSLSNVMPVISIKIHWIGIWHLIFVQVEKTLFPILLK
ncbi:hypothetical protein C1645_206087 [Glomus cerebriforme]|uniref:Uncharacterized protein n=1 Tax=Glomus cerebriforme TaxID=658196 RepID=A0A397SZ27_9GLOM|nr:hypothetical protein C1645_206087 [Glomus cerebriforme]